MMMEMKDSNKTGNDDLVFPSDSRYISDVIKVSVLPDKKGTFLKHTEYEIISEKHNGKVERRYNDFVLLHSCFIRKFVNRSIPRLPPKHLMLDMFLEERRIGLERWLRLVSHHPILANDEILKIFLTDTSGDHLNLMQEEFNRDSDEFLHFPANKNFPEHDIEFLMTNRELLRNHLNHVVKLKRLMEQQAKRETSQSKDFSDMATTLSNIMRDSDDNGLKDFSNSFEEISKESEKTSEKQQRSVTERLIMIIEMLTAHSDMCDRIEKGQISLTQTINSNKQKIKNVIRGSSPQYEEMESADIISRRKSFAMFCLADETKFTRKYMKLLPSILLQFSHEEGRGFSKIGNIFEEIIRIEGDKLNQDLVADDFDNKLK